MPGDSWASFPDPVVSAIRYAAWQMHSRRSVAIIEPIRFGVDLYRVRVRRGTGVIHVSKSFNEVIIHDLREKANRLIHQCAEMKQANQVDFDVVQALTKDDAARTKSIQAGISRSMLNVRTERRDANRKALVELEARSRIASFQLRELEISPVSIDVSIAEVIEGIVVPEAPDVEAIQPPAVEPEAELEPEQEPVEESEEEDHKTPNEPETEKVEDAEAELTDAVL